MFSDNSEFSQRIAQVITDLAEANPLATQGIIAGSVCLISVYAVSKCLNFSVSYGGLKAERNQLPSSHIKGSHAKDNIMAVSVGTSPSSSIINSDTQGSIGSYSIDSSVDKQKLDSITKLIGATTNKKKI